MWKQLFFDLRARLAALFGRGTLRQRLDEEMQFHLEMRERRLIESGIPAAEARSQAMREFGNWPAVKDRALDGWRYGGMERLVQDVRFGLHGLLRRSPGFTAVAVLSLALGIGANTALFSLVDTLMLRPLAVRDPDNLYRIQREVTFGKASKPIPMERQTIDEMKRLGVFTGVVGDASLYRPLVTIRGEADAGRVVEQVTGDFFHALGVPAAAGQVESEAPAVVISEAFWASRFDRSPEALGQTVNVDGADYPVLGVVAASFHGLRPDISTDLWLLSPPGRVGYFPVVGRLRPGVEPGQARAAAAALLTRLDQERGAAYGQPENLRTEVTPARTGFSTIRDDYGRALLALLALVILVLLIACANVGNLMVVRNAARTRELTVRAALGARRSRLVRQLLTEGALLAVMGGALAWMVARAGVAAILAMLPVAAFPDPLVLHMDARMFAFLAAVSLASALLFTLPPAWRATKVDLTTGLKAASPTSTAGGSRRLGRWLVAGQIALSVVLLAGAGLFLGTLRNLGRVDPGFDPRNLVQVEIDTRTSGYVQPSDVAAVYRLLLDRLAAIPGVESVTGMRSSLLGGTPGDVALPQERHDVGPRFFETMRIPLLRGRLFNNADLANPGHPVIVVSESAAQSRFPGEDVVGKTVPGPAGSPPVEIVGVVGDAQLTSLRWAAPTLYVAALQSPVDRVSALLLRTSGDPSQTAREAQEMVRRVNPRLLMVARTMDEVLGRTMARERMAAAASAFFGALALALAGIGLFSVAAFSVARKTNELGIRIALGAGRWDVIREALRETAAVFGVGLGLGAVAAAVGARLAGGWVAGLLFGLNAADTANLIAACVAILLGAVAACLVPAIRATGVDPLHAIRYE